MREAGLHARDVLQATAEEEEEEEAITVVVGPRGIGGVTGALIGCVTDHLARELRRPLVVVP